MTHDEKYLFALTLQPLGIIFRTEVTDLLIRAYWEDLQDLPLAAFQSACRAARRYEKFFPVPATLRELAGFPAEHIPPAEQAWLRLRSRETRYNREALSDPLTRKVFDEMGGGYALEWGFGNWPMEQEERKRREFRSRYREAQNAQAIVMACGNGRPNVHTPQ
jgi:hypothetical protein